MSEQKQGLRKFEAALIGRLRAWYWHFEVERLAAEHFYRNNPALIESKLKVSFCVLITKTIYFFMDEQALLLEPPEPTEPSESEDD